MKKFLFAIFPLLLALSCAGEKIGPDPEDPVVNPPEETAGYYRRSLILDFTGTWCVNCPKMEMAIRDAQALRPGRLVCISVHCLAADKMSVLPLSGTLAGRFGVSAYPSVVTDLSAASLMTTSSAELLLARCDALLAERPLAAGIKIGSSLTDGKVSVQMEAKAVRDGEYSLHCVLLEDGIVASQIGGSADHVHDNVLRAWMDSEVAARGEGETFTWSCTADAAQDWRIIAFVCRGGIVDNVASCKIGESVVYQYEES